MNAAYNLLCSQSHHSLSLFRAQSRVPRDDDNTRCIIQSAHPVLVPEHCRYLPVLAPRSTVKETRSAAVLAQPTTNTTRAAAHLHARLLRLLLGLLGVDNALLDIAGEAIERLLDVDVALSRDLHEGDAQLVG